jgi:hypothetical protein
MPKSSVKINTPKVSPPKNFGKPTPSPASKNLPLKGVKMDTSSLMQKGTS